MRNCNECVLLRLTTCCMRSNNLRDPTISKVYDASAAMRYNANLHRASGEQRYRKKAIQARLHSLLSSSALAFYSTPYFRKFPAHLEIRVSLLRRRNHMSNRPDQRL